MPLIRDDMCACGGVIDGKGTTCCTDCHRKRYEEFNTQHRVTTILDEAAALVDGPREENYGHPADDFARVTRAAAALGVNPQQGPLHHALYMVLVKISRLVRTPDHHDSIVDGAGYFRCYEKVLGKWNHK